MPRGLNTEADPRFLPQLNFSEFTNLTVKGGMIKPRPGDEVFVPQAGSLDEWRLLNLGANDFARVYSADDRKEYYAVCPKAGGVPTVVDFATGSGRDLVYPAPAAKPRVKSMGLGVLPAGFAGKYATAWVDALGGYHTGLSEPVSVDSAEYFEVTLAVPHDQAAPEVDSTLTRTLTSATARVVYSQKWSASAGGDTYKLWYCDKSAPQAWQGGDAVSYGGLSGTLSAGEAVLSSSFNPLFEPGCEPPAEGLKWALYRLEDGTGAWRKIGEAQTGELLGDISKFPYDYANLKLLDPWPGPLDNQYLPHNLVGSLDGVCTLAEHKGCLFAAKGATLLFSEPEQFRYFREGFGLDAGDVILKLVSRQEHLEVYTPTAVKYVVGQSPYFELRETGITEGPLSRDSIVATEAGTFALFDDGVYLVSGLGRKNLSAGVNGPLVATLAGREEAVGGASHGVYYLADTQGRALAYDWEEDEWFLRFFDEKPSGFAYVETARALVARVGASYLALGRSTANVVWALKLKKMGDGRLRPTPSRVFVDATGDVGLELIIGEETVFFEPVDEPGEVNLPIERAAFYTARLTGTGNNLDTVVRTVEFVK